MYYLLYVIFYPISLLPFSILYGISDFTRWLLFDVIKYRKMVVEDNFRQAFPSWDAVKLQHEIRAFEQAFCDQWIETLKLLSMSASSLSMRVQCDWSLFHTYNAKGLNAHVLLGHLFNWEWAGTACQLNIPQQFVGVYLPLNNKGFDAFIYRLRTRLGAKLISAKQFKEGILSIQDTRHVLGLIADQNPGTDKNARWYNFLHRPTMFMTGPERNAQKAQAAVCFAACTKLKRGYYHIELIPITDAAHETAPHFITDTYVRMLAENIAAQPHNWMWTHKRWKRQPTADTIVHELR